MKLYLAALLPFIKSDVPVNCQYSDLIGKWQFQLGDSGGKDLPFQCGYMDLGTVQSTANFEFLEYNTVINTDTKAVGTFTAIYNQGFEFQIDGNVWFAYYYFDIHGCDCSKTSVGYMNSDDGEKWRCIQGFRSAAADLSLNKSSKLKTVNQNIEMHNLPNKKYQNDKNFINKINSIKNLPWTAKHDKNDEQYTLKQLYYRSGANANEINFSNLSKLSTKQKQLLSKQKLNLKNFPKNLDWRNHNGQNYVTPVDDQGACGSCYAFASAGLFESRVRIATNNQEKLVISEQDIITCGQNTTFNQGCGGGFGILTAGKYAKNYGFVDEGCVPYYPANRECQDTSHCKRWFTKDYEYVGGYYGANIGDGGDAMVREMQNGPIAVGFMVTDGFRTYSSGVYVEPGLKSEFNPIVPINHAVLAVGYGECSANDDNCNNDPANEGLKYWIVKNSWGKSFGMDGYFNILRGVDELGIESVPFICSVNV